jgi:aminocarboxymuconate-semialdehyde decarboxylase
MVFFHPIEPRFSPRRYGYHLPNLIGNPLETTVATAALIFGGVIERLPDLKVVLAHGGGNVCMGIGRFDHGRHARVECQQIAGMPSDYARTLYYDTVTHSHLVLRFLLDTMGASQVLLGTDYPADMSQANPVDWLEAAESVSDAERGAILRDNPQRILGARTTE